MKQWYAFFRYGSKAITVFCDISFTYFKRFLVSLPRFIKFLMTVVNNYFELLSSFRNCSPGALNL
jgi:hypothetical protein